ncbi:MAG: hypothetical protein KDA24_28770, partial [Deltaproteobacteria bacterium]|nr:hypothetical protein [Deltaproteobacteria bacterium]
MTTSTGSCGLLAGSGELHCWGSGPHPDRPMSGTELAITPFNVCVLTETGDADCYSEFEGPSELVDGP